MSLLGNKILLYAATEGDLIKCYAAAEACGLSYAECTGNFSQAWSATLNGTELVIAVGGAALYSLYYNPCNWPNPGNQKGGRTPFELFPSGQGVGEIRPKYFLGAAGYTALDTYKLVVMLAYYALHGTFPSGFGALPRQETPQHVCISGSNPKAIIQTIVGTQTTGVTSLPPRVKPASVGVYAAFSSTQAVQDALTLGWKGIGVTGGLGAKGSPYTAVVNGKPDEIVSQVLSKTSGDTWWLSFWTVSWPTGSDSFYQAGHKAGVYVATTIAGYKGKYIPNYVIVDPEGFNQPASTHQDWAHFINGWASGLTTINPHLLAGFYCNQSQYQTYSLGELTTPAFIAVSPIDGNQPFVSGANIRGYIAYYANSPCGNDIRQVETWGGKMNTIQFRDSGVDCTPM